MNKTTQIREAMKHTGYGFWAVYNDKRKDGTRRIKFMRNGWRYNDNFKKKVEQKAVKLMKDMKFIKRMGWSIGERQGYGYDRHHRYDYFFVVY
jgi:hypothetical protein